MTTSRSNNNEKSPITTERIEQQKLGLIITKSAQWQLFNDLLSFLLIAQEASDQLM